MGPMRATFRRTVGRARGLFSTAFAIVGFLGISALFFSRLIESSDGGQTSLPVLLASAAAPVLPVLAALLGMDVLSDERQSGRIDFLLTVAVRERDIVIGKFLGVFALLLFSILLYLGSAVFFLQFLAPSALAGVSPPVLAFAFLALAIQGLLWTAVSVASSACFRHSATAAFASCIVLVILPRAVWSGLMAWSKEGCTAFGDMPIDSSVVDMASGVFPLGATSLYFVLSALALLVATKAVLFCRLVGRGAAGHRLSTAVVIALALLLAVASSFLLLRLTPVADFSVAGTAAPLSPRTRSILTEASGTVTITSFLPRNDPSARSVGRVLRTLKRQSEAIGGVRIEIRFVDPRWDVAAAERLVRRGAAENSLVFEQGRRFVTLPVKDGFGERVCAASIRRISFPPHRQIVYWTVGHGECRFDDYGTFGMSDVARDLFREGFSHQTIDLSANQPIPGDCALILVAGARDHFSRAELDRLGAYLREGGRLLVLLGSAKSGGVVSMLPAWGMRPEDRPFPGTRTLTGSDVVVTDFSDHPIVAPLKGSRIVLDRPVSILPSSVAESGAGVDRIGYSPVAEVGSVAVVAAVERGSGVGNDLALRPMRLVVLGDAGFVLNGQLTARACANRDFFLNCVAYLSGSEARGEGGVETDRFTTGMDRRERFRHAVATIVIFPSALFLVLMAVALRRRHRS